MTNQKKRRNRDFGFGVKKVKPFLFLSFFKCPNSKPLTLSPTFLWKTQHVRLADRDLTFLFFADWPLLHIVSLCFFLLSRPLPHLFQNSRLNKDFFLKKFFYLLRIRKYKLSFKYSTLLLVNLLKCQVHELEISGLELLTSTTG